MAVVRGVRLVLLTLLFLYGSLILPFVYLCTPVFRRRGPAIVRGVAVQMVASVVLLAAASASPNGHHGGDAVLLVNLVAGIYYLSLLLPTAEERKDRHLRRRLEELRTSGRER